MSVVTRFAPSPTGRLHLGHAYAALFAWRAANQAGSRFLLRIEDIDATRCRPEFIAAIYQDLAWLGLDWETPVRRQSEHMEEYRAALDRLQARDLLYPCFCTRAAIRAEITRSSVAPHATVSPGSIPEPAAAGRRTNDAPGLPAAIPLRCASTSQPRSAHRGRYSGGIANAAGSRPSPKPSATSFWRARKRPPAIILRLRWTTIFKA
jgi:glutamyl-Q tRNA(Asp) synthetase